jgi:hypothetical protein
MFRVPKARIERLKQKIKEITRRNWSISMDMRILKLNRLLRGWIQYYKLANMAKILERLDGWIRRRLRALRWKEWKRIKTKHDNLKRLGIGCKKARGYANSRKSYWRISKSWILTKTLSNQYWEEQGYIGFLNYYTVVKIDA